ncbi:MAG: biotin/lipoyl-binding protein [Candidatus Rokubacteria bacterium]|nr:biotin/lipoyl-binding protein [Candidatus Rokubacteria bacterium]
MRLLAAAGVLAGLASLAYGGWVWHWAVTYVWTDDAYVEGTISPISAKVAGHVTELLVRDNQAVRQGDLLLRIDRRDFQAKADQARAAVATAEANLRAARSDVPLTRETTRAQVDQSRAGVESSVVGVRGSESAVEEGRARREARRAATAALRAEVGGAEATHRQAARELARARTLHRSDLVARQPPWRRRGGGSRRPSARSSRPRPTWRCARTRWTRPGSAWPSRGRGSRARRASSTRSRSRTPRSPAPRPACARRAPTSRSSSSSWRTPRCGRRSRGSSPSAASRWGRWCRWASRCWRSCRSTRCGWSPTSRRPSWRGSGPA